MKHIAVLHHLDHGAGRVVGMRHLEHCLMEVVIELLAKRADSLHAVPLHGRLDLGPAHLETGNECRNRLGGHIVFTRRRIEREGQIVDGPHKIAREAGMAIFAGRLQLALGTSPHVLDIGEGAKKLILQRIAFRDKRFEEIGVAGLRVNAIDVAG